MKHTEALSQQTHHKPCLIALLHCKCHSFLDICHLFWIIKISFYYQHKLSAERLVFIAIGGTLVSVFGTLNSEAELHFTFNVLLKQ